MLSEKSVRAGRRLLYSRASKSFYVFQRLVQPQVSNQPYFDAIHLKAICWELQQMADGQNDRLAIAIPPRHFKSFLASVAFPAFMLGLDPTLEIICASYGLGLAEDLGEDTRRLMQSSIYQEIFPETRLSSKKPAADHLLTTKGGRRRATSTAGIITGLGGDLIVYDDPLKASEASSEAARDAAWEWLQNAPTRAAANRIIVPMQRLHADDVIGRIKDKGVWKTLELPAQFALKTKVETGHNTSVTFQPGDILFPNRFTTQSLDTLRAELGEQSFNAQYLQQPSPPGGKLFKIQQFKRFDLATNLKIKQYEAVILSVDPGVSSAPSGDPTAMTLWGVRGYDLYLLSAMRGNWAFSEQFQQVAKFRDICNIVLVERSHSGIMLVEHLLQTKPFPRNFMGFTPKVDKYVRAETAALAVEKGRVYLPEKASWLEAYEKELSAFPHASHDDYVDSTSQLFRQLELGFKPLLELKCYKGPPAIGQVTLYGSKG